MNGTGITPVPPRLSPFSLSVVDNYADEKENAESCGFLDFFFGKCYNATMI